jgi:hypothetical protein
MNDNLENTWNEAAVDYFRVLSRHYPGGTEERHERTQSSTAPPERMSETSVDLEQNVHISLYCISVLKKVIMYRKNKPIGTSEKIL